MKSRKLSILLILCLSVLVRLKGINFHQPDLSESQIIIALETSLKNLLQIFFNGGDRFFSSSLFYIIILKVWKSVLPIPNAEIFFSVFWGILSVYLMYLLVSYLYDYRTGFLASALTAFLPYYVKFSRTVSADAFFEFLVIFSLFLFFKSLPAISTKVENIDIESHFQHINYPQKLYLLFFSLTTILAGIINFSAFFLLLPITICIFMREQKFNKKPFSTIVIASRKRGNPISFFVVYITSFSILSILIIIFLFTALKTNPLLSGETIYKYTPIFSYNPVLYVQALVAILQLYFNVFMSFCGFYNAFDNSLFRGAIASIPIIFITFHLAFFAGLRERRAESRERRAKKDEVGSKKYEMPEANHTAYFVPHTSEPHTTHHAPRTDTGTEDSAECGVRSAECRIFLFVGFCSQIILGFLLSFGKLTLFQSILPAAIFFAIIVSAGFMQFSTKKLKILSIIVASSIIFLVLPSYYKFEKSRNQWKPIVNEVKTNFKKGDCIIFLDGREVYTFYYYSIPAMKKNLFPLFGKLNPRLQENIVIKKKVVKILKGVYEEWATETIDKLSEKYKRIWVIMDEDIPADFQSQRANRIYLRQNFKRLEEKFYGKPNKRFVLHLYATAL